MARPFTRIADLALHDRPRERLVRLGAGALADVELIAIVVGSGTLGEGALTLSTRVLAEAGGLVGMSGQDFDRLSSTRGVGRAKAARIHAAIELGRRICSSSPDDRTLVRTPEDVHHLVGPEMRAFGREHFRVLMLDRRGRHLRTAEIYRGTADGASVRMAEIFRPAVGADARRIVLAHNHPGGDPQPSRADIEMTRAAVAMGHGLGIAVDDHVIFGLEGFVSLRRNGLVNFGPAPAQFAAENSETRRRVTSSTNRTTRSGCPASKRSSSPRVPSGGSAT